MYLLLSNNISDYEIYIEKLILFEFDINRMFTNIINPYLLYDLLDNSCRSSKLFALTIMSIVYGNKNKVFWLLEFAQNNYKNKRPNNRRNVSNNIENYVKSIAINSNLIYNLFRNDNTYEEFIGQINKTGLYSNIYENIYKKTFTSINENKKEDSDN